MPTSRTTSTPLPPLAGEAPPAGVATRSAVGRPRRRPLAQLPSGDLAMAARAGDAEAAGELFRRTRPRARSAVRPFCREADADDAVAIGLIRGLDRLGQLRDPAAVEAWLVRCAVRAATDLARRHRRVEPRPDVAALCDRARPLAASAHDEAVAALEAATLRRAVSDLPPDARRLLALRYAGGLPVAGVARVLDRPEGTVRRQCVAARHGAGERFLRRHLRAPAGACARTCDLLCRSPFRPASWRGRRVARDHLARCLGCRRRYEELETLRAELATR